MRHGGKLLVGVFAVVAAMAAGCTERADPLAPVPSQPEAGLLGLRLDLPLTSLLRVSVLGRPVPLTTAETAGATIGSHGGSIRLPESGLTVVVPAGALDRNVDIKVTALPGNDVAYTFEPHGLVFKSPIRVEQDAGLTTLLGNLLFPRVRGAYFETPPVDGTATVKEFRPTIVDLLRGRIIFTVQNFPGYLLSVG
jgi:hypothetical protein